MTRSRKTLPTCGLWGKGDQEALNKLMPLVMMNASTSQPFYGASGPVILFRRRRWSRSVSVLVDQRNANWQTAHF
jgi:hypothetical protein